MDGTSYYIHKFEIIATGLWSSSALLSVKILHLVDRFDLFNIRNIFFDGREIVRSLTGTVYGGYSELAGRRLSLSKSMGYGTFRNN